MTTGHVQTLVHGQANATGTVSSRPQMDDTLSDLMSSPIPNIQVAPNPPVPSSSSSIRSIPYVICKVVKVLQGASRAALVIGGDEPDHDLPREQRLLVDNSDFCLCGTHTISASSTQYHRSRCGKKHQPACSQCWCSETYHSTLKHIIQVHLTFRRFGKIYTITFVIANILNSDMVYFASRLGGPCSCP